MGNNLRNVIGTAQGTGVGRTMLSGAVEGTGQEAEDEDAIETRVKNKFGADADLDYKQKKHVGNKVRSAAKDDGGYDGALANVETA